MHTPVLKESRGETGMRIRGKGLAWAVKNVTALRQRRFSYGDWLICCFGAGIIGGTAVVLLFGEGALGKGILVGAGREDIWGTGMSSCLTEVFRDGRPERIMREAGVVSLLAKRLLQMTAGWAAGLTICSAFFFGCITCWGGMCLSGALALLTLEKGVWGLPVFLWMMFPQGIIYGITWAVLAGWAGGRERRLHLAAFLLLLLFAAAGAVLEGIFHHP